MPGQDQTLQDLYCELVATISETNGINLHDTLELLSYSQSIHQKKSVHKLILEFRRLLFGFHQDEVDINTLLQHPFSGAMERFLKEFPLRYKEEHIHLTGSLSSEFIFPRLKKLLNGKNKAIYKKKIEEVYGENAFPIKTEQDVERLIR